MKDKPSTPDREGSSASRSDALKELHDRIGGMIDQIGHPDYSLRELAQGMRAVRNELLRMANAPVSERGTSKADKRDAARWRILEHGCQWVSFTETNGETHSFDPRNVTGYQGDLKSMRKFADEIMERQLNILLKDGLEKLKRQFERSDDGR